jgi:hypothetical protein
MRQLLVVGAIAVVMTACANLPPGPGGGAGTPLRGSAAAEALGYHGPVQRTGPRGE